MNLLLFIHTAGEESQENLPKLYLFNWVNTDCEHLAVYYEIVNHNYDQALELFYKIKLENSFAIFRWKIVRTVQFKSDVFPSYLKKIGCHVLRIDDSINRVHLNVYVHPRELPGVGVLFPLWKDASLYFRSH